MTTLPAESLADTFVHPRGFCHNVLMTGPVYRRGTQTIASEEARIRATADAERRRLLEHMHRDIELQVRIARRTLMREAAVLAVGVAEQRIRTRITPADHERLLARYPRQLGAA